MAAGVRSPAIIWYCYQRVSHDEHEVTLERALRLAPEKLAPHVSPP